MSHCSRKLEELLEVCMLPARPAGSLEAQWKQRSQPPHAHHDPGQSQDNNCQSNYPRLKTKAAETAALVQALAALWPSYIDPADQDHQQIVLALAFSRDLDDMLLQIDGWRPGEALAKQLLLTGQCMLQCCSALSKSFFQSLFTLRSSAIGWCTGFS